MCRSVTGQECRALCAVGEGAMTQLLPSLSGACFLPWLSVWLQGGKGV